MFKLDERLERDTRVVGELPLSRLLLMNDAQFPWLILVPRVENATELTDLSSAQELEFWRESRQVSEMLVALFEPDKLNVAALGNVVSQLHIHHIARYKNDIAWPNPVWGRQPAVAYDDSLLSERLREMREYLTLE